MFVCVCIFIYFFFQTDQWFYKINLLRHDVDSAFTPVCYGPVRKKGHALPGVSGHPVGLRWRAGEPGLWISTVRDPKGRTEFLELADDRERWICFRVEELSVHVFLLRGTGKLSFCGAEEES